MHSGCKTTDLTKFYQLIMGSGKSSYIAPLLSLLIISQKLYPLQIMPESLVKQANDNFDILNNFGIKNIKKVISRENNNTYLLDEIIGDNHYNLNIYMSDSSFKSLLLNTVSQNNIDFYKTLQNKLFKCIMIIDEIDNIANPFTCELNYPNMKSKKNIKLLDERVNLFFDFLKFFYISAGEKYKSHHETYEKYSVTNNYNLYQITEEISNDILKTIIKNRITNLTSVINNYLETTYREDDVYKILITKEQFNTQSKLLFINKLEEEIPISTNDIKDMFILVKYLCKMPKNKKDETINEQLKVLVNKDTKRSNYTKQKIVSYIENFYNEEYKDEDYFNIVLKEIFKEKLTNFSLFSMSNKDIIETLIIKNPCLKKWESVLKNNDEIDGIMLLNCPDPSHINEFLDDVVNLNLNIKEQQKVLDALVTLRTNALDLEKKVSQKLLYKKSIKIINKLSILYDFIFNIFPTLITNVCRLNFGLFDTKGNAINQIDKKNLYAIPFKANDVPNESSEFSNINITICYSLISYFYNPKFLREGDYNYLLNLYYLTFKSCEDEIDWLLNNHYTNYQIIFTGISGKKFYNNPNIFYKTYNEIKDIEIVDGIKLNDENEDTVIENKLICLKIYFNLISNNKNYGLFEYENQYNSTFCDIISSNLNTLNRTGFSGTPYFESPLDPDKKKTLQLTPEEDVEAENSIKKSIINDKTKLIEINGGDDIDFIINLLKKDNEIFPYNVIIDVGAYFVGFSNHQVAKKIIDIAKCDFVVFLDTYQNENDVQVYINKLEINDKKPVDNSNEMWKKKNFIVYFDQKHITGTDIKIIPLDAKGLLLLKYNNSIRDYSQGAFRLRKINITQSVNIICDKYTTDKLKIKTNNQLFCYLSKREKSLLKDKTNYQALHNLRTILRNEFLNKEILRIKYQINKNYKNLDINLFNIKSSSELSKSINNLFTDINIHYKLECKYIIDILKSNFEINYYTLKVINELYKKVSDNINSMKKDHHKEQEQEQEKEQEK